MLYLYSSLSHLLQMRGLKQLEITLISINITVASFTDAWIETDAEAKSILVTMVASFTDAWIETDIEHCYLLNSEVASFTDAWIETTITKTGSQTSLCRIFYRCVD